MTFHCCYKFFDNGSTFWGLLPHIQRTKTRSSISTGCFSKESLGMTITSFQQIYFSKSNYSNQHEKWIKKNNSFSHAVPTDTLFHDNKKQSHLCRRLSNFILFSDSDSITEIIIIVIAWEILYCWFVSMSVRFFRKPADIPIKFLWQNLQHQQTMKFDHWKPHYWVWKRIFQSEPLLQQSSIIYTENITFNINDFRINNKCFCSYNIPICL